MNGESLQTLITIAVGILVPSVGWIFNSMITLRERTAKNEGMILGYQDHIGRIEKDLDEIKVDLKKLTNFVARRSGVGVRKIEPGDTLS